MGRPSNGSAPLRIGTRGSALALWQTERVRTLLAEAGYESERVEITTTGDVILDTPLSEIGSRAIFTKELDDALLDGRIDIAVHSLKDLPTQMPGGIALGAIGAREDPRDALIGRGALVWRDVPPEAIVATSSPRRRAQLLRARPDLQIVDVRGNIDTRLRKLDADGRWSAIVLATAGLVRLGLADRIGERLPPALMLPAPGQGALAATVRADDEGADAAARVALHDPATALAVAAERGFLGRLEGGCQVPVGALAEATAAGLQLRGRVISLSGDAAVEGTVAGPVDGVEAAAELGAKLAERLLAEGAGAILHAVREATRETEVDSVPES